MLRIASGANVNSQDFRQNALHNRRLADELKERQRAVRFQRPERELERLRRQNKLFVRDRIDALLDPNTPFLELSTLAANKAYNGEVPGAAQVVGIGIVAGREVMVHADDASVKGGAWYPLSVKKIVRALDITIENRLSVIHLCDGGIPTFSGRVLRRSLLRGSDPP
ncbi:acetyl-CoA carboxylase carboxyltransferase component [Bradyrhizobium sp. LM3.4]